MQMLRCYILECADLTFRELMSFEGEFLSEREVSFLSPSSAGPGCRNARAHPNRRGISNSPGGVGVYEASLRRGELCNSSLPFLRKSCGL